jgi:hypothetical protein
MARGADGTQFHEEPVHIRHGPKPGILSGERAETLNDLLTTGNGREGKVAGRLLIAPPVQHRLEHLLGGVEQRHIPGDLPPAAPAGPSPLPASSPRMTLDAFAYYAGVWQNVL